MRTLDDAALEANFAAVKGTIGCDRVAELETELRRSGDPQKGRCPLPDHEDTTPSFFCYPNGHGFYGSWWCFGCDRGGDVVDLWQAQQGPFGNLVIAMEDLAERFGQQLWRPEDLISDAQLAGRRARRRLEPARDARAHAWAYVFYCWHTKEGQQHVVTAGDPLNTGNNSTNNYTGDNIT